MSVLRSEIPVLVAGMAVKRYSKKNQATLCQGSSKFCVRKVQGLKELLSFTGFSPGLGFMVFVFRARFKGFGSLQGRGITGSALEARLSRTKA